MKKKKKDRMVTGDRRSREVYKYNNYQKTGTVLNICDK